MESISIFVGNYNLRLNSIEEQIFKYLVSEYYTQICKYDLLVMDACSACIWVNTSKKFPKTLANSIRILGDNIYNLLNQCPMNFPSDNINLSYSKVYPNFPNRYSFTIFMVFGTHHIRKS